MPSSDMQTPQQIAAEHWAVSLDDEAEQLAETLDVEIGRPIPVDPTAPTQEPSAEPEPWRAEPAERRALVPDWVRSAEERKAAVLWLARNLFHTCAYHVVRSPKYAARLLACSPRGTRRVVVAVAKWVADFESRPLRTAAVAARDSGDYLRLLNTHRETVRSRLFVLCGGLLALAIAVGVLVSPATSTWLKTTCALVVVAGLGLIGRRSDKPLLDHAVVTPRARKLTADVVTRAFVAGGLCKDTDPITFPQPIQRDGHGWRATVDLPWGVTAEQAIKRRDRIASGLDLDEVQVWPERVRGTTGSARRVALWVADEDPYAKPSGRWPWAENKSEASLFGPFPFGQDQRGRLIELRLMFTGVLVGAIPRMGKTLAARLLMLAAALDPYTELHVYDGKGGQDWRGFAKIAHRAGFGARTETVQALRDDLGAVRDDMNDRYDRIAELPADVCPDARITPKLARSKSLALHPIVVSIDECQRYFEDPTFGDEIVDLLTELAKVGPAVGIVLVLATQKPDGESVPTRLRDVIGTRFALKTMTYQSSDAVLGAGSYSAGYDASRFQRAHKGVGWLLGADDSGEVDDAVVVRTFMASAADVGKVIDQAHAARVAACTLTGTAVGDGPDAEPVDVLADVLAVFAPGEDKLWSERILDRLTTLRPPHYHRWTTVQLAAALRPYGIATQQVWDTADDGAGANRRGITRADLRAANDAKSERKPQ
ncbi:MAG: cell division protein FtsK [Propionibacteriales bacterium]|nr:cell division protein FtsK [Propionibacteriales bacterium]